VISIIIPAYNNLRHLKNAYASICKHAPAVELILIDDASTDGTWEWLQDLKATDDKLITLRVSDQRLGHTILYDVGIKHATNEIVGILHADMIIGPNYIENMVKHLKKGIVVAGTRIEPPLHPPGAEKIIQDFGTDFDNLNVRAFDEFCIQKQVEYKNTVTKGMFAPWIIYKADFEVMGGHDHIFAPFPYEDSDIFERWILSGYKLIQSRDAFVYHLTCRGHRWNEQVGKDDEYFQKASYKAAREYIRKWGSWIKNDEFQHPIIKPKYNIGYVVKNCNLEVMRALEPWCDTFYSDDEMGVLAAAYYEIEQPQTKFDLKQRLKVSKYSTFDNDILVEFDSKSLNNQSIMMLQNLPEIIKESGEVGTFELDVFKITIKSMKTYERKMIQPLFKHTI